MSGELFTFIWQGAITWLVNHAINVISPKINRLDPRIPTVFGYLFIGIWFLSGILLILYLQKGQLGYPWVTAFLFFSGALIIHLSSFRIKLSSLGIRGADKTISKGIDYKRALDLCQNRFDLLGIGAVKITEEIKALKGTLARVSIDEQVRFLLCKPDEPSLGEAATRFGKNNDEYKNRVINSLRTIADLRRQYSNINVRFYKGNQMFRLMLIDDSLCLLSYYVMGQGDGSQLPQVHIVKLSNETEVKSFYWPFKRYFNELWEKSEVWDFKRYLND